MKITLTRLTDPDRRVRAIKNLRTAHLPVNGAPLGLKAAKDIVDALALGLPQIVDVNRNLTLDLSMSFEWTCAAHASASDGVPVDLVVDFMLEALARAHPDDAAVLKASTPYVRLREALR
jgi:hypothetical protein